MTDTLNQDPIRVLIVDDSAVIRGFTSRAIADIPDALVVGSVSDGQAAVNFVRRELVDIVILDIEMPIMDGLTALPQIVALSRYSRVIMSSTLTVQGAEVSIRALTLGAADYVAKPTSTRELDATAEWKHDLVQKVENLGAAARAERKRLGKSGALPAGVQMRGTAPVAGAAAAPAKSRLYEGAAVKLRPVSQQMPEVLAIGSSTGGPQALFAVLPHLKGLNQPIVITQHMPKTFTSILAEHITRQTGLPCEEAKEGSVLAPGKAILAAGDYHMLFERKGVQVITHLDQGAPENFCRPAVDPMLRSLMTIYEPKRILTTILTGMGSDGMRGSEKLVAAGGMVVGQDQPSSVVWGMPGAVATAGLCSAVLPLNEIGQWLRRRATGAPL